MAEVRFRYFLAVRPDAPSRLLLAALGERAGQGRRRVEAELLHLTLCTLVESPERDRFVTARVESAFSGWALSSVAVRLAIVRGGPVGASAGVVGRQPELQDLYREVVGRLAEQGLFPLHRKSGLKPHVTLGYDPCRFDPFGAQCAWMPDELLLIESEIGRKTHNVLARWPLLPPRQGVLPFDAEPAPAALAARRAEAGAGRAR